jgi:L-histidine N-alpha-methyltransferase
MPAPPAAIRARIESEPSRKTAREEILPRATVWVDELTDDPKAFALSVARGLSTRPRQLDCRYLYDDVGSELFAQITQQPEYYPTRTEAEILARHAGELAGALGAVPICELGSGSSDKTRLLLEAWAGEAEGEFHYVPVDIDPGVLRAASATLVDAHSQLRVSGLATSYENALERVREISPKLVLFLGSTIGNFEPHEMEKFLRGVETALQPGDAFLLGVDLVKDVATLEAAYNDAAGITERFTLNLFERMNRELDAGIPEKAVEHVAFWNERDDQIEIYGRFRQDVQIELPGLEQGFEVQSGEMVRVEVSRKFRIDRLTGDLARHRLRTERVLTDLEERFALLLLRRVGNPDQAHHAA